LKDKVKKHKELKEKLAQLYAFVFDGPTSGDTPLGAILVSFNISETEFPRDDQLEQQLQAAQDVHSNISNHINAESQAVSLLKQADGYMGTCEHHMAQALGYSTWGEHICPLI
jgi:hypothetical protein